MKILVNTNSSVKGDERLQEIVERIVLANLGRFNEYVSRIEVHIQDVNSEKGGETDKECTMEGRIEGRRPTAVTHKAGAVDEAVEGASEKLARALDTAVGKMRDKRRGK